MQGLELIGVVVRDDTVRVTRARRPFLVGGVVVGALQIPAVPAAVGRGCRPAARLWGGGKIVPLDARGQNADELQVVAPRVSRTTFGLADV